MDRRILRYILIGLIAVATLLRVVEVFEHNPLDHIFSDPARHWNEASEPLTASPMSLFDPPLYQMWLSLLQKLTLQIPGLIAAIVAAVSVATSWLWYRAARELAGETLGLCAWAVFAWLPSWIGIYDYFMTETLMLPLLGASLWQTLRAHRLRTVSSFVALAVLWLACGLTRAIALPLGAIACAGVWWAHPQRWRAAAFATLIAAAILVPLGVRNEHEVGLWQPWGNGWLTRIYAESGRRELHAHVWRDGWNWNYDFTAPSMVQNPLEPFSDWTSAREGLVEFNVDLSAKDADWRAALDQNSIHGVQRWKLRAENVLLVLVGESWPQNNRAYLTGRAANLVRWIWAPLLVIVSVACFIRRRQLAREPLPWLLPALMAAWFVLQASSLIAVNEGRYRMPLEGLLILQCLLLMKGRIRAGNAQEGVALH